MNMCTNCKGKIVGRPQLFQSVVICEDCFKIVSHYMNKAKRELQMVFLTYTDALRVSLIRGQCFPPRMPKDGKKGMPATELGQAIQELGARYGKETRSETAGEGEVRPLREGASDQNRQARGRTGDPAVPRRR